MSTLEMFLIVFLVTENVGLLLAHWLDRQIYRDGFGEDATRAMRRRT